MGLRVCAPSTILGSVGAVGSCASVTLAMGCCLAPSVLVSALASAGLGGMLALDLDLLIPVLYGLVGVSVAGVAWACWRGRLWSPLALAGAGAVAVLIPFHEGLDVRLFYLLGFGGQVSLLTAAALPAIGARWNRMGQVRRVAKGRHHQASSESRRSGDDGEPRR